jgi:hypothetical protein
MISYDHLPFDITLVVRNVNPPGVNIGRVSLNRQRLFIDDWRLWWNPGVIYPNPNGNGGQCKQTKYEDHFKSAIFLCHGIKIAITISKLLTVINKSLFFLLWHASMSIQIKRAIRGVTE